MLEDNLYEILDPKKYNFLKERKVGKKEKKNIKSNIHHIKIKKENKAKSVK